MPKGNCNLTPRLESPHLEMQTRITVASEQCIFFLLFHQLEKIDYNSATMGPKDIYHLKTDIGGNSLVQTVFEIA